MTDNTASLGFEQELWKALDLLRNDSDFRGELLKDDQRRANGTPPAGNANYAWVRQIDRLWAGSEILAARVMCGLGGV